MRHVLSLLAGGLALAALTGGPASATCSGASCGMSNNRQAMSPNQFTVSRGLISQDGSGFQKGLAGKPSAGQLLSPANTNPNGLMRGVGH